MSKINNKTTPLYVQVKNLLITRIAKHEWRPGTIIPSEMALAHELNISQGTIRRAITDLVEKNILLRQQGRGTFVANHNHKRTLFYFFHLVHKNGQKALPESNNIACRKKIATKEESSALQISKDQKVIRIDRIRILNNKPIIIEKIILPALLFEGLEKTGLNQLPNNLYELYELRFGMMVVNADERLRAIRSSNREAILLNINAGDPLLEIKRIASNLDKRPIEFRVSRCCTDDYHYHNSLN